MVKTSVQKHYVLSILTYQIQLSSYIYSQQITDQKINILHVVTPQLSSYADSDR